MDSSSTGFRHQVAEVFLRPSSAFDVSFTAVRTFDTDFFDKELRRDTDLDPHLVEHTYTYEYNYDYEF